MILKGNDALDKANKMFESLGVSQKKDSFSNVEGIFSAYDGNTYGIVKEGTKYHIKKGNIAKPNSPKDFDYIEGVQNKARYARNTITEAEHTLNLWNIEFSRVYGNSRINEDLQGKKAVLRLPAPETDQPEAPMEQPAEVMGAEPDAAATDAAAPAPVDMGAEEMPAEDSEDMGDEGSDDLDEDPKKLIQKLAGKLAYELREFQGEESEYGDIANFALGMVASAVKADKLSDKDMRSIKKKVSKSLESHEDDELNLDIPDGEEMPEDSEAPEAEAPTEEMPAETEETLKESLKGAKVGTWILDFKNSKAPQFKGKSAKEKREMAIAGYLQSQKSKKGKKTKTVKEGYFFEEDDADEHLLFDNSLGESDEALGLSIDSEKENYSYGSEFLGEDDMMFEFDNFQEENDDDKLMFELDDFESEDDDMMFEDDDMMFELDDFESEDDDTMGDDTMGDDTMGDEVFEEDNYLFEISLSELRKRKKKV